MPGHKILPNSTLLTVMKHSNLQDIEDNALHFEFEVPLPPSPRRAAPWHTSVRSGIRRRRQSVRPSVRLYMDLVRLACSF